MDDSGKATIKIKTREFTPAEAARVSGVSPSLQRLWRRRELLPTKQYDGWNGFELEDVIQLTILDFYSRSGFYIKKCQYLSHLGILPTLAMIEDAPGAVEISGNPPEDFVFPGVTRHATDRYLVALHGPNVESDDSFNHIGRAESLEPIGQYLAEHGADGVSVLDLKAIAERIVERAGVPLFRVEVVADAGAA